MLESSRGSGNSHTEIGAEVDVGSAREVLRSCVCSRTRMLDRLLTRLYDDALAPVGLRVNQLTILAIIASMDGLRAVDVGHFLEMDKSTVSRGLGLLKEKGWVEGTRQPGRRRTTLTLTPAGADILSRAMPSSVRSRWTRSIMLPSLRASMNSVSLRRSRCLRFFLSRVTNQRHTGMPVV